MTERSQLFFIGMDVALYMGGLITISFIKRGEKNESTT